MEAILTNLKKLNPMKQLMTFVMCVSTLLATAQTTYPYNPDENSDGTIETNDVLSVLSYFGDAFQPEGITVDGVALAELLSQMLDMQESFAMALDSLEGAVIAQNQIIANLEDSISSLALLVGSGPSGGIPGLDQYLSVDTSTQMVLFSGANLQIVNGLDSTDAPVNGLGNLIVGYNEEFDFDTALFDASVWERIGSHNLIVGPHHTYKSYGGILGGSTNRIFTPHSSILGGRFNGAGADYSAIVAGEFNVTAADYSVVVGGGGNQTGNWNNLYTGTRNVIVGGSNNHAFGMLGVVLGGDGVNNYAHTGVLLGDYFSTFLDTESYEYLICPCPQ